MLSFKLLNINVIYLCSYCKNPLYCMQYEVMFRPCHRFKCQIGLHVHTSLCLSLGTSLMIVWILLHEENWCQDSPWPQHQWSPSVQWPRDQGLKHQSPPRHRNWAVLYIPCPQTQIKNLEDCENPEWCMCMKMYSRRGEKFLSFVERRSVIALTTLLAASAQLLWPEQ